MRRFLYSHGGLIIKERQHRDNQSAGIIRFMITLEDCYQKNPSMVARQIAGETILVPVRQKAEDLESLYTLNETAARIWELIDGNRTLGEIRDQVVLEYDTSIEEVWQDILELVGQLQEIEAIESA
jgi:predicted transcriptional regulator